MALTSRSDRASEVRPADLAPPNKHLHWADSGQSLTSALLYVLLLFLSSSHPSADPSAPRNETRLAMLRELADIGMALVRGLPGQSAEAETNRADLGLQFARISRAVRQTLALEERMEADGLDREAALQRRLAAERAAEEKRLATERRCRVTLHRREVGERVEQLFDAQVDDGDAEDLHERIAEWTYDYRETDDDADRSIPELIAQICKALGLAPDWSLWADEDWAAQMGEPPIVTSLPKQVRIRRAASPRWRGKDTALDDDEDDEFDENDETDVLASSPTQVGAGEAEAPTAAGP